MSHTAWEAKSRDLNSLGESGCMDHTQLHLCPMMGGPIGQMASRDWGGKGSRGRRWMGPCAGQLAFVKWSKTEALFSSRHSQDKARGWHKETRHSLLRSRWTSLSALAQEAHASWGSKRKGVLSNNKWGHAPIGLCDGIHLSKKLGMHLGEDPRTSQVWKEKGDNRSNVNKALEGLSYSRGLHHLFTSLLIQDSLIPLRRVSLPCLSQKNKLLLYVLSHLCGVSSNKLPSCFYNFASLNIPALQRGKEPGSLCF